jgi:hypothetical protein
VPLIPVLAHMSNYTIPPESSTQGDVCLVQEDQIYPAIVRSSNRYARKQQA